MSVVRSLVTGKSLMVSTVNFVKSTFAIATVILSLSTRLLKWQILMQNAKQFFC